MGNENCLAGVKCPKCGNEDKFFIHASAEFEVTDDGTDLYSGVGWDESACIRCPECGEHGKVGDFTKRDEDLKPFEVAGYVRKRFTTIVMAKDENHALELGSDLVHVNGIDIEDDWDEDYEYYDASVDNARELDPDQFKAAEERRQKLMAKWQLQAEQKEILKEIRERNVSESCLDELVHELATQPASEINNGGFEDQVKFIFEQLGDKAAAAIREELDGE